jgi:hypothetical protein
MNTNDPVKCYGIRRLNPFLGILQIIEAEVGRASTTNGRIWHLELQITWPAGWGSLNAHNKINSWQLIGLWSAKEGLIKAPMVAGKWHDEICERLVVQIVNHQHELPFPLTDLRELWLLDEIDHKPLALLMSMQPGARHSIHKPRFWRGCLERSGIGSAHHFSEIDQLERLVRRRAGFKVRHLWVTWDADRKSAVNDQGERFSRSDFPRFGLTENWQQESSRALVKRYIDWIAPALLTLSTLHKEERHRLETNLSRSPSRIEYYWRLYPRILDREKLLPNRMHGREAVDRRGMSG